MNTYEKPLEWVTNPRAREIAKSAAVSSVFPDGVFEQARRFHRQIHLASHNRYLVQQLDLVYRSMALMATTSLAAEGRGAAALNEHQVIVDAIRGHKEQEAYDALKAHISSAFVQRLTQDSAANTSP